MADLAPRLIGRPPLANRVPCLVISRAVCRDAQSAEFG